jgi:hypothetical protein
MLTNYIERKDTSLMLVRYIQRKDTALMLSKYVLASNSVDGSTIYAPKYITDTVSLTTGKALKLTDDGKWISITASNKVNIRVPADTAYNLPIGTVINFSMDGAGMVCFTKGTGVVFQSEKDSVCINTRYGVATLVKRAANKWRLFGSLTD